MDVTPGWAKHLDRLAGLLLGAVLFLCIGIAPSAEAVVPEKQDPKLSVRNASTLSHKNRPEPRALRSIGEQPPYAPARLIVKYKDTVTASASGATAMGRSMQQITADGSDSLDQLYRKYGVSQATPVFRSQQAESQLPKTNGLVSTQTLVASAGQEGGLVQVYRLGLASNADVEAAVRDFQADPHVAYAQPDYTVEAFAAPNDLYYSSSGAWGQEYDDLWGLKQIQAEPAWSQASGQGVIVAVVDTGVDYNHPDLAANIWTNTREIANNGVDDDQNGFVDDVRGWDFSSCPTCIPAKAPDNDPMDGFGHGTHVAGTIAAVGNNGIGIVGVAPKAKIMAVKGLTDSGSGSISDLAMGIVYAAKNGAKVINNSWGCGYCPTNPVAEDAVRTAMGLGAVVVFAAGNSGANDVVNRSPQNMQSPKPVVVSASDPWDKRASFSSYGATVDIAAPGGGAWFDASNNALRNILSLKASQCGASMCPEALVVGGQYVRQAGTSMAAPHVAGAAAVVLSRAPGATPDNVRTILRSYAEDIGPSGADVEFGAGRLNLARAVGVTVARPVGRITAPVEALTVGMAIETVDVQGTASGTNFRQYQLELGERADPVKWTILKTSTNPVTNGLLGSLSVSDLPISDYILRLWVTDTAGQRRGSFVSFGIEPEFRRLTKDAANNTLPGLTSTSVRWKQFSTAGLTYVEQNLADNTRKTHTFANGFLDYYNYKPPALSSTFASYAGVDSAENALYAIWSRKLSTGADTQMSTGIGFNVGTVQAGNWMAWFYQPLFEVEPGLFDDIFDLFVHNFGTGARTKLGLAGNNQVNPDIDGNYVVYIEQDMRNPNLPGFVYVHNLAAGTRQKLMSPGWETLCGSTPYLDAAFPRVSGTKVVWPTINTSLYGGSCSGNTVPDLYLYDLATAKGKWLTQKNGGLFSAIQGNRFAWTPIAGDNPDIYIGDSVSGTTRRITAHPAYQSFPAVYGDRVVWYDERYLNPNWQSNGPTSIPNTDIMLFEMPDLNVSAFKFYRQGAAEIPANEVIPLVGQTVTVRAVLTNTGKSATGIFRVSCFTNISGKTEGKHPSLGAEQTSADPLLRFDWKIMSNYTSPQVRCTADTQDRIPESDESNNTWSKEVTVWPSDLIVSGLTVPVTLTLPAPTAPVAAAAPGKTVSVTSTVKNFVVSDSPMATASNFQVALYLSKDLVQSADDTALTPVRTVAALAPGQSSTATVSAVIPAAQPIGSYFVCAKVDSTDTVTEQRETNNTFCLSQQVFVARPDLRSYLGVPNPSGVGNGFQIVKPGGTFKGYETTTNLDASGMTLPAGAFVVAYRLSKDSIWGNADDVPLTLTRAVAAVGAQATAYATPTLTVPASTAEGAYQLCSMADVNNAVIEANEANNATCSEISSTLEVQRADLSLLQIEPNAATATAGGYLSVSDVLYNGKGVPSVATITHYRLSKNLIYGDADDVAVATVRSVPALAPMATNTATLSLVVPATTPGGSYHVCAALDATNAEAESNEANNAGCGAKTVAIPYADLTLTALTTSLAGVARGGTVTVTSTVKNAGASGSATAVNFHVAYYLSTDAIVSLGDILLPTVRLVAALAPGYSSAAATAEIIPSTVTPGNYYLCAEADPKQVVSESNEGNNTSSVIGVGCRTLTVN